MTEQTFQTRDEALRNAEDRFGVGAAEGRDFVLQRRGTAGGQTRYVVLDAVLDTGTDVYDF